MKPPAGARTYARATGAFAAKLAYFAGVAGGYAQLARKLRTSASVTELKALAEGKTVRALAFDDVQSQFLRCVSALVDEDVARRRAASVALPRDNQRRAQATKGTPTSTGRVRYGLVPINQRASQGAAT